MLLLEKKSRRSQNVVIKQWNYEQFEGKGKQWQLTSIPSGVPEMWVDNITSLIAALRKLDWTSHYSVTDGKQLPNGKIHHNWQDCYEINTTKLIWGEMDLWTEQNFSIMWNIIKLWGSACKGSKNLHICACFSCDHYLPSTAYRWIDQPKIKVLSSCITYLWCVAGMVDLILSASGFY